MSAPSLTAVRQDLSEWVNRNLQGLLSADDGWRLPLVADWVLVFAVEDGADDEPGATVGILSSSSQTYRTIGLLSQAMSEVGAEEEREE